PSEQIAYLEQLVQRGLRPDLTLLLDAPVDMALERARARNRNRGDATDDRFEQEQRDFFDRVRTAYLAIADADANRVRVIDASLDLPSVEQAVRRIIVQFLQSNR